MPVKMHTAALRDVESSTSRSAAGLFCCCVTVRTIFILFIRSSMLLTPDTSAGTMQIQIPKSSHNSGTIRISAETQFAAGIPPIMEGEQLFSLYKQLYVHKCCGEGSFFRFSSISLAYNFCYIAYLFYNATEENKSRKMSLVTIVSWR